MTLSINNRLLAIEQSSRPKVANKKSSTKNMRKVSKPENGSRLNSIAQAVSGHPVPADENRSIVSSYFAQEWSVRSSGMTQTNQSQTLSAPMAASIAQPLQTDLIHHQMSMHNGSVLVDAQLSARPLQSVSQSSFFDDFDAINEAKPVASESPDAVFDQAQPKQAVLRAPPEPNTETTLQGASQRTDQGTNQGTNQISSQGEAPTSRIDGAVQNQGTFRTQHEATNNDDDFLAELDSITALSKSRSTKKMPKQFSGEVDAFQKELDSMVGKPSAATTPPTAQKNPTEADASPYKGTSAGLSNHSVFDRLATTRPYANSFNLGSVNVGDRFDQFDVELDREEARTQTKIANDLGLSELDVVADLSEISENANVNAEPDMTKPVAAEDQTQASQPSQAETESQATHQDAQQTVYRVPVIKSNQHITPWAAGAAMLVAWQGQWSVENIEQGDGPWAEFVPLLGSTDSGHLSQWQIETITAPHDVPGWQQLLVQRGPLLMGDTEQVLVLTKLDNDTHLIRVDQGAMQVAFDDFEELLARLQLSDAFVVAALVNDQSQIG